MAAFYNQATLSYSGGTVNSNITSGEIVEVLSATKTAVTSEYRQGSEITYAVNIINSGNIAYTGLTLTDDLGAYAFGTDTIVPFDYIADSVKYFINGVLQTSPAVTVADNLVISGISVPAEGTATVLYTVIANEYASPEESATITNTVVISADGITNVTATETVTSDASPYLDITKSVSPLTVTENGQLTYTFVIQNSGNTAAVVTDNVVITDVFDPILSNIAVSYNGAAWVSPDNYTYDTATGVFETVAGEITVPPATFVQNTATGIWTVTPGTATVTVTGNV